MNYPVWTRVCLRFEYAIEPLVAQGKEHIVSQQLQHRRQNPASHIVHVHVIITPYWRPEVAVKSQYHIVYLRRKPPAMVVDTLRTMHDNMLKGLRISRVSEDMQMTGRWC